MKTMGDLEFEGGLIRELSRIGDALERIADKTESRKETSNSGSGSSFQ